MTLLLGKHKRYSQGHIRASTRASSVHTPCSRLPPAGILKEEVRARRPLVRCRPRPYSPRTHPPTPHKEFSMLSSPIHRCTLIHGAAWSAPTIIASSAVHLHRFNAVCRPFCHPGSRTGRYLLHRVADCLRLALTHPFAYRYHHQAARDFPPNWASFQLRDRGRGPR